ncbi:DUF4044 domain-containing protein [Vagococcus coleopterorum]|nr:DUF4044 domain-containing protein [Vagococcus coleopterorum]
MSDKKNSTFSKITKVVVWVMLVAMLGAALVSAYVGIAGAL